MVRLTTAEVGRKIGNIVIYEVSRFGSRTTQYYYTTKAEALKKYDELCKRGGYGWVELNRVGSRFAVTTLYCTQDMVTYSNGHKVEHRDIRKNRRN